MSRQSFIRLLLSLLLLVSQQMASTHALSHWRATLAGTSVQAHQDGADLSSAFAQDPTCDQCLAFAQLAAPVGLTPRAFAVPGQLANGLASAEPQASCARPLCAFQPRGPPQA